MSYQDQYNKFVSLVDLEKIELSSLTCEQNYHFQTKNNPVDIAIGYGVIRPNQAEGKITYQIDFQVRAFLSNNLSPDRIENIPDDSIVFTIEFGLIVIYNVDGDSLSQFRDDTDVLDAFATNNVTIHAWPYARELVSSMTTRMGFPALQLPLKKSSV